MAQSLSKILIHLVFSTKHRERLLSDDVRSELHPYMNKILVEMDSPAIAIGSVEDHIHILFRLSKNHALCKVIEEVKTSSSKWIKTKGAQFRNFHWQSGYGAFSVSQSNVEEVRAYIANQKEHHRTKTFQEEFRTFLKKYEVDFDERYVWD
ncbi:MAG: IS200/IS605 family transposase [Verrucomicrobiota bacterium]